MLQIDKLQSWKETVVIWNIETKKTSFARAQRTHIYILRWPDLRSMKDMPISFSVPLSYQCARQCITGVNDFVKVNTYSIYTPLVDSLLLDIYICIYTYIYIYIYVCMNVCISEYRVLGFASSTSFLNDKLRFGLHCDARIKTLRKKIQSVERGTLRGWNRWNRV